MFIQVLQTIATYALFFKSRKRYLHCTLSYIYWLMFQCKYCGKAFASHAAHDSHVRRTHAQEKANSCKECGQQFGHIFDLKLHMRVHEGR